MFDDCDTVWEWIVALFLCALGGTFVLLGAIALFFNEEEHERVRLSLNEAEEHTLVVENAADLAAKPNGSLVHVTGLAENDEVLKDELFQVGENWLVLQRRVQYYQWVETRHEDEDDVWYEHGKQWIDHPVNSDDFRVTQGHENYVSFADCENMCWYAPKAHVMGFLLNEMQLKNIEEESELLGQAWRHPNRVGSKRIKSLRQELSCSSPESQGLNTLIHEDKLYISASQVNVNEPQIGDICIAWTGVAPREISLIAMRGEKGFEPYLAESNKPVQLVALGKKSVEDMYIDAQDDNFINSWFFRFCSFLLVFFGFKIIFRPFLCFDEAKKSLLYALITAAFAIILALLIHRPSLGLALLLIVCALWAWRRRSM